MNPQMPSDHLASSLAFTTNIAEQLHQTDNPPSEDTSTTDTSQAAPADLDKKIDDRISAVLAPVLDKILELIQAEETGENGQTGTQKSNS